MCPIQYKKFDAKKIEDFYFVSTIEIKVNSFKNIKNIPFHKLPDGNISCYYFLTIYNQSFLQLCNFYLNHLFKVDPEAPISFSMHPNTSLEEYDGVNLSCVANVGHPGGWLTIIRLDSPNVQLGNGSFFDIKTENCSSMAHLSVHYSLSQRDLGANFRCYLQNNQSLHKDFGPINLFCKLKKFFITLIFILYIVIS